MWQQILKFNSPINFSDAISSFGLSVFTKYLPGKVLTIIGKAEYIKQKYNYQLKLLISRSLISQIIAMWSGLIFGAFSLIWNDNFHKWIIYLVLPFIVFSLIIFTTFFHSYIRKTIRFLFKRDFDIPQLDFISTIKILPVFFIYWALISLAFYLLLSSLLNTSINISLPFIFPLANVLGIVFLIAPGGIGIREGVLAILLHTSGMDLALATSISIFTRLWFLMGESFIFLLSIVLEIYNKFWRSNSSKLR